MTHLRFNKKLLTRRLRNWQQLKMPGCWCSLVLLPVKDRMLPPGGRGPHRNSKFGFDNRLESRSLRPLNPFFETASKYRGLKKVGRAFTLAAAAYNLVRLPKLIAATWAARPSRLSYHRQTHLGPNKIHSIPTGNRPPHQKPATSLNPSSWLCCPTIHPSRTASSSLCQSLGLRQGQGYYFRGDNAKLDDEN